MIEPTKDERAAELEREIESGRVVVDAKQMHRYFVSWIEWALFTAFVMIIGLLLWLANLVGELSEVGYANRATTCGNMILNGLEPEELPEDCRSAKVASRFDAEFLAQARDINLQERFDAIADATVQAIDEAETGETGTE